MIAQALLASTAIIFLSFISEDAATISSALSVFGGPISWPLGFAACFAGIWLGDLGLYSLARCFGKPILKSRWIARFAEAAVIERCQEKFNEHGSMGLLASRSPLILRPACFQCRSRDSPLSLQSRRSCGLEAFSRSPSCLVRKR